ncbi:uncharacterized protein K441DRAFT_584284, partial [Cenococcum geophilum 1.58]|uniref:uncharacterized protein n=1 Tax=Cenococcum geophilum 1.58 TaxID=794803 RepID=UPI00358E6C8B
KKYKFYISKVIYLGLIISRNEIKIDPKKIAIIINWEKPKNVKDVRAFIRFANFY